MCSFLPLPDDDDTPILRREAYQYGFPQPQTFAGWASQPSKAPCELPYFMVGRHAAYTVSTLRRLREALTYRDTTARSIARCEKGLKSGVNHRTPRRHDQ